jgi:type I restriction enzyme M protein
VGELQRYSFLSTNIDVKGKAYEELVGANLRGDRGEFFTPRNVQKMTIRMLAPKVTDKILDQSCGTGGFLVIAMNEVIEKLKQQAGVTEQSDVWMRDALNSKIRETAQANFFGIDINPDLVKATKMNMVMNNDGSGNILGRIHCCIPISGKMISASNLQKLLELIQMIYAVQKT